MPAAKKYSDELRERARVWRWSPVVRSRRSRAIWGVHKEALRAWVRQAKADAAGGTPSTLSSAERERLKEP